MGGLQLGFKEGADSNNGFLDVGAWVSILNRSGADYPEARLKLIAGDVNRAQPVPQQIRMRTLEAAAAADVAGFAEQSFFEFHLYTLGRPTTIPDNSTKQIELFPKVREVAAKKLLVYYGFQPGFGFFADPITDRDFGLPMNTKVDVYLEFENSESLGLGIPLPAGRMRVSQLDAQDDTLRIHRRRHHRSHAEGRIGFDHARLGIRRRGERRQVDFQVDHDARRMEETIEIKSATTSRSPSKS